VADYLLAPVFLKFVSIVVAVIVVLYDRPDESPAVGFTKVFVWLGLVSAMLICLFVFSRLCIMLKNAHMIRSIYTPLITLPAMVIAEFCMQNVMRFLLDWPPSGTGAFLLGVAKIGVVVILMDILYGSYIAPHHPHTLPKTETATQGLPVSDNAPTAAEPPTVAARPDISPIAETAQPATRTASKIRITESIPPQTLRKPGLQLGCERIEFASLVMIKAEDHYLQVITNQRSFMVREKLGNVVAQLDLDIGVQVNRSCWIARSSIRSVVRNPETGSVVVHSHDLSLPVARARVALFMDCLKRWNIDMNRAMAA
jgi:hypothetical protein